MRTVGALKRRGLKSLFKDEWVFLSGDEIIGVLTERSMVGSFISRLLTFIPQSYVAVSSDGRQVAEVKRGFNLFVLNYDMTIFEPDPPIDRRLLIAAGILLAGIEGREGGNGISLLKLFGND